MLYDGVSTMIKPRCKLDTVSVPEAVCVSFVPPNPPAADTLRVYCKPAEPNESSWTRLAVPPGVKIVSPPTEVMAGAPPNEPVSRLRNVQVVPPTAVVDGGPAFRS